jgi:hypothetical protein
VYSTNYLSRFFTPVDQLQKMPYNTGLRPVIQSVIAQTTPCDTIWMQSMNQAYMYYIFLSQFPPADYLALDVTKSTITGLPYLYVPQVGNWRFGDYPEHEIPLADASDDCETPRTIYLTLQSDLPQEWERLDTGTTTAEPTQWQAVVLEAPIIEQNFWDRAAAQPGGGGFTMP